jgi:hypothetical protein
MPGALPLSLVVAAVLLEHPAVTAARAVTADARISRRR